MSIYQKKYLLKPSVTDYIQSHKPKKSKITQFYTKISLCYEVRYRAMDGRYFKTTKTGNQKERKHQVKEINKKSFEKAKRKKIGNVIHKDRYTLTISDQKYALDRYKKGLKPLYILEKSFKNSKKYQTFTPAKPLLKYIEKDVSENERYYNKYLALLGNPNEESYELYALFQDIQSHRIQEMHQLIFPEMNIADGIRLILYKHLIDLCEAEKRLKKDHRFDDLKDFYHILTEIKVLLHTFRRLFDKQSFQKLYQNIRMIQKSARITDYGNFFKDELTLLEAIFDEKQTLHFIKKLDETTEIKKQKFIKFLTTREYRIIVDQFQRLLKESKFIRTQYAQESSLGYIARHTISKKYQKICRIAKKYEKCYEKEGYKKITYDLNKLIILLNTFKSFYPPKHYKKFAKHAHKLQKILDAYLELHHDMKKLKFYIQDQSFNLQDQNRLLNHLKHYTKDQDKKLHQAIEKRSQKFTALGTNLLRF